MELTNKVCLITGGTKGIGAAAAILFAKRGADVAIVARNANDAAANETYRAVEAAGRKCLMFAGDMAKPVDAVEAVARTASALGEVDVLVHSAGGPAPGGVMDVTPEAWMA